MSKLDEVIGKLNKQYGQTVVSTDKDNIAFKIKDRVPFPTPALTYLFGGGLPTNIIMELSGNFSSGKTTLCAAIAGEFQRYYKKKWQDSVDELQSKEKLTKDEAKTLAELKEI